MCSRILGVVRVVAAAALTMIGGSGCGKSTNSTCTANCVAVFSDFGRDAGRVAPRAAPLDAGVKPIDAGAKALDAGAEARFDAGACFDPRAAQCNCDDGRSGMRACIGGFPSAPCTCSGPAPMSDTRCIPGSTAACSCNLGQTGFRVCHGDRALGECACAIECGSDVDAGDDSDAGVCSAPTCADSAAFDGICPGDPVRHVVSDASVGSVYLRASVAAGNCDTLLVPIWPLEQMEAYAGLDCGSRGFRFGGDSDELYFMDDRGLIQLDDQGKQWLWPTPPCSTGVSAFRFFSGNRYAYQCAQTVYLDDGSVIASGVDALVLAMSSDDPRVLVKVATTSSTAGDAVVVYDILGNQLSRFAPGEQTGDTFTLLPDAASCSGFDAFVLFDRGSELANSAHELVAYHLDVDNHWSVVRRVAVPQAIGDVRLVLPDGTILGEERDPANAGQRRVQVWLADGSEETAWKDSDHVSVEAERPEQLVIGPDQPKGSNAMSLVRP